MLSVSIQRIAVGTFIGHCMCLLLEEVNNVFFSFVDTFCPITMVPTNKTQTHFFQYFQHIQHAIWTCPRGSPSRAASPRSNLSSFRGNREGKPCVHIMCICDIHTHTCVYIYIYRYAIIHLYVCIIMCSKDVVNDIVPTLGLRWPEIGFFPPDS